jgi:hypothetical protein
MTEQPQSAIGTVAQEAARLIEDMATMARSGSSRSDDPSPYAGGPPPEPVSPEARHAPPPEPVSPEARHAPPPAEDPEASDEPSPDVCSVCGGEGDDTPATCRLCPLCRGIALLRAVRPETVDLLADLAVAIAASLRDVATRARAADPASSARPASGASDRVTVQDIPVDDESEGWRT